MAPATQSGARDYAARLTLGYFLEPLWGEPKGTTWASRPGLPIAPKRKRRCVEQRGRMHGNLLTNRVRRLAPPAPAEEHPSLALGARFRNLPDDAFLLVPTVELVYKASEANSSPLKKCGAGFQPVFWPAGNRCHTGKQPFSTDE